MYFIPALRGHLVEMPIFVIDAVPLRHAVFDTLVQPTYIGTYNRHMKTKFMILWLQDHTKSQLFKIGYSKTTYFTFKIYIYIL